MIDAIRQFRELPVEDNSNRAIRHNVDPLHQHSALSDSPDILVRTETLADRPEELLTPRRSS